MIFEAEVQRFDQVADTARGRDVRVAGGGIAGGVIVRDNDAVCVEVESAAHQAAQGHSSASPIAAGVEVLGNEQPVTREEQYEDAFLPPAADPADEVVAKVAGACVDRFTEQRLACGGIGKTTCRGDGGSDIGTASARR